MIAAAKVVVPVSPELQQKPHNIECVWIYRIKVIRT